jgi:hypothetical protein
MGPSRASPTSTANLSTASWSGLPRSSLSGLLPLPSVLPAILPSLAACVRTTADRIHLHPIALVSPIIRRLKQSVDFWLKLDGPSSSPDTSCPQPYDLVSDICLSLISFRASSTSITASLAFSSQIILRHLLSVLSTAVVDLRDPPASFFSTRDSPREKVVFFKHLKFNSLAPSATIHEQKYSRFSSTLSPACYRFATRCFQTQAIHLGQRPFLLTRHLIKYTSHFHLFPPVIRSSFSGQD